MSQMTNVDHDEDALEAPELGQHLALSFVYFANSECFEKVPMACRLTLEGLKEVRASAGRLQ